MTSEPLEASDLLDAADHLDRARPYLNDPELCRPPEMRTDLLRLHGLAMHVVGGGGTKEEARELRSLALDLGAQVADVLEHLESVRYTLHALLAAVDELDDEGDLNDFV